MSEDPRTLPAGLRAGCLAAALTIGATAAAWSQEPVVEVDPELPFATRRVIDIALDAEDATIVAGDTAVARGDTLGGSLVHLGGRLVLEGSVAGGVTAVDSEVVLRPGARIGGDLTVLGGSFYGTTMAEVAGEETWLREEPVAVVRPVPGRVRIERVGVEAGFPIEPKGVMGIVIHEYNGVDGLLFGLAAGLRELPEQPRTELVFGPVFRSERAEVGWDVHGLREIPRAGITVGGRVYRITDTRQRWQRSDLANSLAALAIADDDRTYFERTGYSAWVERSAGLPVTVRVRWRDDDFDSLESEEPFAFLDEEGWPKNPPIDEGRGRALGARVTLDRRNAPDFPTGGFLVEGRYDHWGFGGDFTFDWGRVDARAWVPLFGESFLGLRAMAGGRLGSSEVPSHTWWRLGSGASIVGYEAFSERLTGDRMAFGNARLHLGIPSPAGMFESLYLVGIADVGDAWFEEEGAVWNAGFGGGIAGKGKFRYIGVFGGYGVESEQWKAYFLISPWF
ncbi:MAG: BamA/TamA family outer membrane protein [Gemmatimonadota bacterium]|nr:BamA/TamA family outer membrane protein [Gemmatimonadota bacterium]